MKPPPPSLLRTLPPQLSSEDCQRLVELHLRCTPTQARVVVAGVDGGTCAELAKQLDMAEGTVRAHYHAFFERVHCVGRSHATAIIVALIWSTAASNT